LIARDARIAATRSSPRRPDANFFNTKITKDTKAMVTLVRFVSFVFDLGGARQSEDWRAVPAAQPAGRIAAPTCGPGGPGG